MKKRRVPEAPSWQISTLLTAGLPPAASQAPFAKTPATAVGALIRKCGDADADFKTLTSEALLAVGIAQLAEFPRRARRHDGALGVGAPVALLILQLQSWTWHRMRAPRCVFVVCVLTQRVIRLQCWCS